MDFIFLGLLCFVIVEALVYRFLWRRKTLGFKEWIAIVISLFAASVLPLVFGVWLPDLRGQIQTLASATAKSGHRIEVVQYWNHIDFYTTEVRVVAPGGAVAVTTLDHDASKSWWADIQVHPSDNRAVVVVRRYRPIAVTW